MDRRIGGHAEGELSLRSNEAAGALEDPAPKRVQAFDEGDSTWDIGVSLLKTALNRRAGELRLAAQIGESPVVLAELYQPLDVALRYFITPQVFFDSRSVSRFEGGDEIEEIRVKRYGGGLAAGRVLGRWGEIRAGLRRYAGDMEVRIGEPANESWGI